MTGCVPQRMDPAKETVLYRVLQESLSNVHKHAQATRVEITVVGAGDSIALTVTDDGVGFDASDRNVVRKAGHLGLVSMQERVELAGGTLTLESSSGRGTTVRAVLPATDKEQLDVLATPCPAR